jgi:hypothetical protein
VLKGDKYVINGSKLLLQMGCMQITTCKTSPELGIRELASLMDSNLKGITANKLDKLGWSIRYCRVSI